MLSAPNEAPRKKSHTVLLPLLIVLFLISYSILTMLVIEQGRTIEAQRSLLREMLRDSSQLAELKGKLAQETKQVQPPPANPTAKDPATSKTPAAKVPNKEAKRPGKSAGAMKTVPGKPEADLEDVRRSTRIL